VPFFLNERDEGTVSWADEWPFPARAHFIKSKAYDTLIREVTRYVKGEVTGRSFLIAGHRGAGKTALVRQVVDDLNRAIIDTAVAAAKMVDRDKGRMLDQQRPLLVKLHGPSLLASAKPKQAQPAAKKADTSNPDSSSSPSKAGKDGTKRSAAPKEKAGVGEPAAEVPDLTVTALEQITVALYRALAAEFARSFTNHARDEIYQAEKSGLPRGPVADFLELAGQFALELDNIPRPAELRSFYQRLGRIQAGVLWPFEIGAALLDAGLNDRGIREIVALSTAAQAFEVCSGEIESKQTDKNQRSNESSVETKGDAAFKDVIDKIAGLAVGAGVGAASFTSLGAPGAIALGFGAWLVSTVTLSWTSKRTAKTERSVDYTFVRKRDKASLERDLPLVIERVRGAGLAPVFMLDELDKLDDAATSIATLIKSLKHLTTDFGCFCFLTDRKYYDELMDKVGREAFPVEHTYFSHFLFILPHPDRFLEFLSEITKFRASTQDVDDNAARAIFGLFVLHRSKLNMVEVLRELAEQCDSEGVLRRSPAELKHPEYAFAASIQLAIGLILKQDGMRQRIEAEPRFMQWAVDALYLLSRAWENKEAKVLLGHAAVVQCLLKRSGAPAGPGSDESRLLKTGMTSADLKLIKQSVLAVAELLSDSVKLKTDLSKDGRPVMADIVPQQNLIKKVGATEFQFIYDLYGQEVDVRDRLRQALADANLSTEIKKEIDEPVDFLKELTVALGKLDLKINDLVELQILSATIDAAELERATQRLDAASRQDTPYEGLAKDLPLVGAIRAFAKQNGPRLSALSRLAVQVAADSRKGKDGSLVPIRQALNAIATYIDLRTFFQQADVGARLDTVKGRQPDPGGPPLFDTVQSVKDWSNHLDQLRASLAATEPAIAAYDHAQLWEAWRGRIVAHLTGASSPVEPASYSDIVYAAADQAPGKLFQRDLGQMSVGQWSDICASGFPETAAEGTPAWLFAAGLYALGFGRNVLDPAVQLLGTAEQAEWKTIISHAPGRNVGRLLIIRNRGAAIASEPASLGRSSATPYLALPIASLNDYDRLFQWLINRKALAATVEELRPDEDQETDL
jgi:hypothetical protein